MAIFQDEFIRVKNDINGNPRYVLHFLALAEADYSKGLPERYADALAIAKLAGGKKFHNKAYGGGISFTTYSLRDLCNKLNQLLPC